MFKNKIMEEVCLSNLGFNKCQKFILMTLTSFLNDCANLSSSKLMPFFHYCAMFSSVFI